MPKRVELTIAGDKDLQVFAMEVARGSVQALPLAVCEPLKILYNNA